MISWTKNRLVLTSMISTLLFSATKAIQAILPIKLQPLPVQSGKPETDSLSFIAPTLTALLFAVLFGVLSAVTSQAFAEVGIGSGAKKFAQLEQLLPTPNVYRTASGAPGNAYWQQQADYVIEARLDEAKRTITGTQKVTYWNNSPDALNYLWVQLDQNRFKRDSINLKTATTSNSQDRLSFRNLRTEQNLDDNSYGHRITRLVDARGQKLNSTIVDTMMRIDLPKPLAPGKKFNFELDWNYNIVEQAAMGGRAGFSSFEKGDADIFFLAQWHPRMTAYTDYAGWQHKQFLGRGEFTLEFGDYDVKLTVPDDHIVSSTGSLENAKDVLTKSQQKRLASANDKTPTFIVTPDEALANEKTGSNGTSTWHFKAKNVRDFAWASSRKFIWDAMIHNQPGAEYERVLAMSFYPNEAEPIWSHYSTHSVVHTMEVYSRFSFDYPYPTAQSVNAWKSGGMEYPMITFNGYRPTPFKTTDNDDDDAEETAEETANDGKPTYSRRIKYGLVGVIIHEIGHIYFPMTVNSDERQWTWMDEGLNTFLEYVAELEWEENFPAFSEKTNVLDYIPEYMTSTNQVPIMTNSESILQFGPNAYSKPAAALTVLRETVMGRELFDFAFREYAQRWKFKRPTPSDFFRTMEDASAVDLDWFWRGWFYSTDHVDIAVNDIREYKVKHKDPEKDFPLDREEYREKYPAPVMEERNRATLGDTRLERFPELADFYNEHDKFTVSNKDRNDYTKYIRKLEPWERRTLARALEEDHYIYFVEFENKGGVPTPLPLTIQFADASTRQTMIPAEIWRVNSELVTKVFIEPVQITSISVDDRHQTADADFSNNRFPATITKSRLELYKSKNTRRDLMKDMLKKLKANNKAGGKSQDVQLSP